MQNKSRGGRRENAGRKPLDIETGARAKTGITMPAEFYEALRAMHVRQRAKTIDTGLSITIPAMQQSTGIPGQLECLLVYNALSEAIKSLEYDRDINPNTGMEDEETHWTPAQASLHRLLNCWWDEIRRHELFTEPSTENE